jgi:putative ABC transport system substrate-binding protein
MKRRKLITLIGGIAIAWPLANYAQEPKQPLKRVGVLSQAECPIALDSQVRRRLAELGWVDGRNFVFDCASSIGHLDQLQAPARELVLRHPDVLISGQWSSVVALEQETTTIPIIMSGTWEPIGLGLITNFARPEGNITGVAYFWLLPKQMEFLKEIVPNLRRVALIRAANPAPPPQVSKIANDLLRAAASKLGLTWEVFRPVVANEYDEIFARLATEHFEAAYIIGDPLNSQPQNIARISQLALRHLIPAIGEQAAFARGGLLLSYSQDTLWSLARASEYVDKILRGAKPSDLPVEQATKLELVINLKTAKTLGLTVPPSLLARADEVIE